MGYKKVCLECRLSFNRPIDFVAGLTYLCPKCGKPMTPITHRFKVPKKSDLKAWETVKFLIQNGFPYQHIHKVENEKKLDEYIKFPKNLDDAKEFIEKYKNQALKE